MRRKAILGSVTAFGHLSKDCGGDEVPVLSRRMANVVELVDAPDLKSVGRFLPSGFKSRRWHLGKLELA